MSLEDSNSKTFFTHLEELRYALIKCLSAIAIFSMLSLYFYPTLLLFFTSSYEAQEKQSTFAEHQIQQVEVFNPSSTPQTYRIKNSEKLIELKLNQEKIEPLPSSLLIPAKGTLTLKSKEKYMPLNVISPFEGLSSIFKIGLLSGIAFSSPFCLYWIFQFISPALETKKKRFFIPIFFLSCLNLAVGVYLGQRFCLPFAIETLKEINLPFGQNLWSLENYLDLGVYVTLGAALLLELILSMFLLVHFGNIGPRKLAKARKYFMIFALILGAFFTPPDVISQVAFALPLICFYELCYLYSHIRKRLRKPSLSY
jgi:sec-independent protein translocase protein TatC